MYQEARTERAELKEHDAHFIQTTSQTKEHRKTKRKKNTLLAFAVESMYRVMMLGITMAILDPYHQTQRSQLDEYIDAENSHKV